MLPNCSEMVLVSNSQHDTGCLQCFTVSMGTYVCYIICAPLEEPNTTITVISNFWGKIEGPRKSPS